MAKMEEVFNGSNMASGFGIGRKNVGKLLLRHHLDDEIKSRRSNEKGLGKRWFG